MISRPTSGRDKRVCVAQIGAAHGLKGEVRLWSFTQDPAAVAEYGPLETADAARTLEIAALRPSKDHFIAKFEGVDDRNAAETLRNVELYIARERLPATRSDEYYHSDLIGLAAVTAQGGELGEIVAVLNFGAGDILEIRLTASGETVMLPFTDAVAPEIDLANRTIVIVPPEGALDQPSSSRPSAPKRRASRDP